MALAGGGSRKRKKIRRAGKSAGGVKALRSGGKLARNRPQSASAGVRIHSTLRKVRSALVKKNCAVANRQLNEAEDILRTMPSGTAKSKARSMVGRENDRLDYLCK